MASRKEWFAVLASMALIGALVGLVFLTGQPVRGDPISLQPWYTYEGATLTWDAQRVWHGETEEALVTSRVKEVTDRTIVLFQEGGGRAVNVTLSREDIEERYTTLARRIALQGLRIRNVTYHAEFVRYDVGEHSFAALHESGSYESIGIGPVVSEHVTDLTTFAPLFLNASLRVDIPGGPQPPWLNETRRLTAFQGIQPIAAESMNVFEMRFENDLTLLHSFNVPDLSIDTQDGTVNVAFVSAQEALIASLIDMRTMPVLDVVPGIASQSLVSINETHSLLRVRTSPGSFQFTLTLGQEPAMIEARTSLSLSSANALVRTGRRSPSP